MISDITDSSISSSPISLVCKYCERDLALGPVGVGERGRGRGGGREQNTVLMKLTRGSEEARREEAGALSRNPPQPQEIELGYVVCRRVLISLEASLGRLDLLEETRANSPESRSGKSYLC